jgi:hypothetical protein
MVTSGGSNGGTGSAATRQQNNPIITNGKYAVFQFTIVMMAIPIEN